MAHFTTRPELIGTFGAVGSTHWIASAVGMKILEAGGNAFDAAVAAGFVLQIVEPHLNGPAGDATILVSRGEDAEATVICGQGVAPAAATIEHFQKLDLDLIPGTGLLAACVPGAFGAWLTMLRDWGTISLRSALEPAIEYAQAGHPLLASAASTIESVRDLFENEWPTSAAVFLENGAAPASGTLFCNPMLAALYNRIVAVAEAASGNREAQIEVALAFWYEGFVAEKIADFCSANEVLDVSGRKHTGLLTTDDMSGWRPPIERAVSIEYRGHIIYKCGAWSQGPSLLQALRILEGYDLAEMDPEGPELIHTIAEAVKLAMADRDAWYGDTGRVPLDKLLSQTYGGERRKLLSANASLEIRPGAIDGHIPKIPYNSQKFSPSDGAAGLGGGEPTFLHEKQKARAAQEAIPKSYKVQRGDTCHLDIVDRWGNMVSATPSGGWLQSSPIIPELGFALGTRMQMFSLEPDTESALVPGKRPRTTLTPTMVFKDSKPYLALGTPGGDQQEQWSLLLLINHIDFGMPLQLAIDAPAFHTEHMCSSFWPRTITLGSLHLEGRYSEATIEALRSRGHTVVVGGPWSEGRLSAVSRETAFGGSMIMRAAANPRGMQGYAIAR